MKMKKVIIIVLGIVLILFIVFIISPFSKTSVTNGKLANNSRKISANANNEIEFQVTASIVRKGELITWLNTSGYAYPIQEYEIKPKISGQITELNAYDGEKVKKDELLFKLDDSQYKLDVNQAKSNLVRAQIDYELQKSSQVTGSLNLSHYKHKLDSLSIIYNRKKQLYEKQKISYEDFNSIKRDYEALKTIATLNREDVIASRSGLTNAATNYEKAILNLSYTKFVSPISGLVADCNIAKGSYVTLGELSLKVIDISYIKMLIEVTGSDLVKIHLGDPIEAEFIALPNKKFNGKIIEINPSINLIKRTALVTAILHNQRLLIKPGMFASVKIGTSTYLNEILIPHSALLVRENRTLVFTVKSGLAQWKYVTLGESNGQYYIIKRGLKAGDTLIIGGNYNLAHLSRVKINSFEKY